MTDSSRLAEQEHAFTLLYEAVYRDLVGSSSAVPVTIGRRTLSLRFSS